MEKLAAKTRETLRIIDKVEKLYQTGLKKVTQLQSAARSNKRVYVRDRNRLLRTRVEMSLLVRSIHFNENEKNRLIDILRHTVERVHALEREIGRLERRLRGAPHHSTSGARPELRGCRVHPKDLEHLNPIHSNRLKPTLKVILRSEAEAQQAKGELI